MGVRAHVNFKDFCLAYGAFSSFSVIQSKWRHNVTSYLTHVTLQLLEIWTYFIPTYSNEILEIENHYFHKIIYHKKTGLILGTSEHSPLENTFFKSYNHENRELYTFLNSHGWNNSLSQCTAVYEGRTKIWVAPIFFSTFNNVR